MAKLKPICGIYGIHNTENGKWYIGQSIDVHSRIMMHFASLRNLRHHNCYLQASFLKYGKECFEAHILEVVTPDMLDVRERAWIKYYESNLKWFGYNTDEGGSARRCFSAETREKMSKAAKGKKISAETIEKIRLTMRGVKKSPEHCLKISKALTGKKRSVPFSEEWRRKMSISRMGHKTSASASAKISEANRKRWERWRIANGKTAKD